MSATEDESTVLGVASLLHWMTYAQAVTLLELIELAIAAEPEGGLMLLRVARDKRMPIADLRACLRALAEEKLAAVDVGPILDRFKAARLPAPQARPKRKRKR